jgi:hypothetical protein
MSGITLSSSPDVRPRRRITVRRSLPLVAAAAATVIAATAAVLSPAQAITYGELDNDDHPMVGLMVAQDENGTPLGRCSGTLISSTVYVTAGHCTTDGDGGDADHVELWFGPGEYRVDPEFRAAVRAGDTTPCQVDDGWDGDTTNGDDDRQLTTYPCAGGDRSGTAYTNPDYDDAQYWMRDLGVVVLDEPWVLPEGNYGELPEPGAYDGWRSNDKVTFTAVGYGLQKAHGPGAAWRDIANVVRMVSHPRLVLVNKPYVGDYNMQVSGNARTGGTCFGDSGGPFFLGDTLEMVGVTSYGMSAQTCGGTSGIYRLDRLEDLAWLSGFLEQ